MTVTVKFFASVREIVGARSQSIELPEGSTVAALWQTYVDKFPRLASMALAHAVNHEYSGMQRVLKEGDEVAFIPPVSGG